ncbi:DUF3606 domain-containing protein [Sphingosinicella sp. BN140058]|nr:DUF3606 domain-containing protein [Sphingosinicella sp. BN140058]
MADDKSNVCEPDGNRVEGPKRCEVSYFASKHEISAEQARDLIDTHRNDEATSTARLRS